MTFIPVFGRLLSRRANVHIFLDILNNQSICRMEDSEVEPDAKHYGVVEGLAPADPVRRYLNHIAFGELCYLRVRIYAP